MKRNKIRKSRGEKIFVVCNYTFMVLMMFVMFYPMWYVFVASISDAKLLSAHTGLLFLPEGWSLAAYKLMLTNPMIFIGYKIQFWYLWAD